MHTGEDCDGLEVVGVALFQGDSDRLSSGLVVIAIVRWHRRPTESSPPAHSSVVATPA